MAFTSRTNVPQCNQVNLTKPLNMRSCYHGTSVQVHPTLIGRKLSLQDYISAQSMRCGTMGKWHNVASRPCSSSQGDWHSIKNCCLSLALMWASTGSSHTDCFSVEGLVERSEVQSLEGTRVTKEKRKTGFLLLYLFNVTLQESRPSLISHVHYSRGRDHSVPPNWDCSCQVWWCVESWLSLPRSSPTGWLLRCWRRSAFVTERRLRNSKSDERRSRRKKTLALLCKPRAASSRSADPLGPAEGIHSRRHQQQSTDREGWFPRGSTVDAFHGLAGTQMLKELTTTTLQN